MNKKIAEVQIFVETGVSRFVDYEYKNEYKLSAGHLEAQLRRFEHLWKIGFFVDPEVTKQRGTEFLKCLKDGIKLLILNKYDRDDSLETLTASLANTLVGVEGFHLQGRKVVKAPTPLMLARTDAATVAECYPTEARTLLSFIETDGNHGDSTDAE